MGAARLQFAEGLLNQIKQMSQANQLQVMRDLANRADTTVSRSYANFSVNTKLAFWFELGEFSYSASFVLELFQPESLCLLALWE